MYTIFYQPLYIAVTTVLLTSTLGLSTYQKWMCLRLGEDLSKCEITCSDGFARPKGCEICLCRESLCSSSTAKKCPTGWHCEVETSGYPWFRVDKTVCEKDKISLQAARRMPRPTTSTTTPTTTSTTTTTTTTTTTRTPVKTATSRLSPKSTAAPFETVSISVQGLQAQQSNIAATCEQNGRCDETGICEEPSYICRSDGRCCRPLSDSENPRCQQMPSFGFCRGANRLYVYDINIGKCVETIHGACGSSVNKFQSMEECRELCEKPCQIPQSEGPCRANLPLYYFDLKVNKCLIFDYGGCQGSVNHFITAESCQRQCSGLGRPVRTSVFSSRARLAGSHLTFSSGQGTNETNDNNNEATTTARESDSANGTLQTDNSNNAFATGLSLNEQISNNALASIPVNKNDKENDTEPTRKPTTTEKYEDKSTSNPEDSEYNNRPNMLRFAGSSSNNGQQTQEDEEEDSVTTQKLESKSDEGRGTSGDDNGGVTKKDNATTKKTTEQPQQQNLLAFLTRFWRKG